MQGVSSRTRSRNATKHQSLDDVIPFMRRKRVFKNDQRKKVNLDDEKGDKIEEVEGSDMLIDKGNAFFNDSCVLGGEKPIIIDLVSDSESDHVNVDDGHVNVNVNVDDGHVNGDVNDDDGDGLCTSCDESETSDDDDGDGLCSSSDEGGTSDEDFEGSESSSSEESYSSYGDEKEEEVVRKVKNEINGMRRCIRDGVSERNYEKVEDGAENQEKLKHAECDTASGSTLENNNDESGVEDQVELKELCEKMNKSLRGEEEDEDIDSLTGNICTNEATPEKKNCYEKKGVKRRKNEVESDDGVQVIEVKAQKNKKKKDYSLRSRQNVEPVLEELGDSTKVQKSRSKNASANEKVDSHERKVHNVRGNARTDRKYDGDHNVKRGGLFKPKELRLMEKLFAEWGEENSKKKDSIGLKVKDSVGDVHKVDTSPPACGKSLPPIWSLEEKSEPLEKFEAEKVEDLKPLWEEMDICRKEEQMDSMIGNKGANEATPTSLCEHHNNDNYLHLDEEIGIYCKLCDIVVTEIKNISPPVVDRFPYEGSVNRVSYSGVKCSVFDEFRLKDYDGDSKAFLCHKEGTVWDLIPNVKQSLYRHQQEGYEFIWKNLAGNINLNKLESPNRCSEGGCIISHYPGTGKTRLTIMFLKSYLKVYPDCKPVIVAPASLMLTWEREFKKWDIGVPFHNLNNLELSGKEDAEAINSMDSLINLQRGTEASRSVKLSSWLNIKEKSILGISYKLYGQLAGSKYRKKNGKLRKDDPNMSLTGKVLREVPGLLVLDEGHIPRNRNSRIWKVLVEEVQTKKRILLSGTPFQNNFVELFNILTVVKPSFPDTIPLKLKNFCRNRQKQEMKPSEEWSWEPISSGNAAGNLANDKISQLKSRMDSFVHVHSGSILKKKLPGLRKCVLTLKPDSFQKEILDSIESSQDNFTFENKLALVSVHPSLFLSCTELTKKEDSVLDKERLKELQLKPYGGVKTRYLVEFVRLCDAVNEKVLVFSQYIKPLRLIIKQLKSFFGWSEGKEVLYMSGKVDPNTKQSRIDSFNDPKSEAKIMLASTKACNEGISLVGASRVVLLDVVWNPSVERQAISRAYRIGQNKIVYTYHLITEGTAELTKYGKQAEKERLSELVFSDKDAAENDAPNSCAVNLEDRILDRMTRHENLKDMFA